MLLGQLAIPQHPRPLLCWGDHEEEVTFPDKLPMHAGNAHLR